MPLNALLFACLCCLPVCRMPIVLRCSIFFVYSSLPVVLMVHICTSLSSAASRRTPKRPNAQTAIHGEYALELGSHRLCLPRNSAWLADPGGRGPEAVSERGSRPGNCHQKTKPTNSSWLQCRACLPGNGHRSPSDPVQHPSSQSAWPPGCCKLAACAAGHGSWCWKRALWLSGFPGATRCSSPVSNG